MMPTPATPPTDTALDHALALIACGLRPVPIRPGGKHPPMSSWQHAHPTAETARNWWNGLYRDCGVGLVMGPQNDGRYLIALDIDTHYPANDGWEALHDLETEHGTIPDTWRSLTGSGGAHLLFAVPPGVVVRNQQAGGNRIAPGIDVRGDGGQIVVAPSIHPNTKRAYAWENAPWETDLAECPGWLLELVRERQVLDIPTTPTTASSGDSPAEDIRHWWDWQHELKARHWQLKSTDGTDTYWTRPGKNPRDGHSAVLHGNDVLVVFTTEIPHTWHQAGIRTADGSGYSFSPFGFYAAVEHAGDRSAAARALRGTTAPPAAQHAAADDTAPQNEPADDWIRVDLTEIAAAILAGTHEPELPVHLEVDGGIPLLYPGRTHSIFGPPGGGKTWVALAALAERLKTGETVLMIDWEDAAAGTAQRLVQLGCTIDDITRFDYRNPSSSLRFGWPTIRDDTTPWTLVVIDSAGESMAAEGIEIADDMGTAQWMQRAKRIAARPERPSVLMLDHVPKTNGDEPAKYAIGSQRKLAAITGASYRCDTVIEPAKGKDGKLKLVVVKDRLGNRAKGSTACEVHLSGGDESVTLGFRISDAQAAAERGERFRPTHLMERVSRWLEINPGATRRTIVKEVSGRSVAIQQAIDVLVEEGWVKVTKNGQAHEHTVVRDYREAEEAVDNLVNPPTVSTVSHRVPTVSGTRVPPLIQTVSTVSPSLLDGDTGHGLRGNDENTACPPVDNPEVDLDPGPLF